MFNNNNNSYSGYIVDGKKRDRKADVLTPREYPTERQLVQTIPSSHCIVSEKKSERERERKRKRESERERGGGRERERLKRV